MNKAIITVFLFWWFIGGIGNNRTVQFGHFRTEQQCNEVRKDLTSIMGGYATRCWFTEIKN